MENNMYIYVSKDGNIKVDVNIKDESVWMSQEVMANLYDTTKNNISMHLKNIFDEGELKKESTVKKFLTVQKEGNRDVKRNIEHYNLDAIIAVGYRINSKKATEFRIWATKILKDSGQISHEQALKKAHAEYDKYMESHLTTAEQDYLDALNKKVEEINK